VTSGMSQLTLLGEVKEDCRDGAASNVRLGFPTRVARSSGT
jgi:hypothetical protein